MYTYSGLADLHRHLDGSIRPETLAEFAASAATPVPKDLPFSPGMGLSSALSRFAFTLSLLKKPSAVERVAREMCEDAVREGVTSLEVRFAPQLHTPLMSGSNAISGITIVGALLAVGESSNNTLLGILGFCAIVFGTINVVGGYLVTDRMLKMFKKK